MAKLTRRHRSWKRPLALAAVIAGVTATVMAVVGWNDLRSARQQVIAARAELQRVQSGATLDTDAGRADATRRAEDAAGRLGQARRRVTNSVPLRAAGFVPGIADQRRAAVDLLGKAEGAGRAAASLLSNLETVAGDMEVRDGRIPLRPLRGLEGAVRAASLRLGELPEVKGRPWGPLADATDELDRTVADARQRLDAMADGLSSARTFLGGGERRRYFVAAQNNAEMRDQGTVLSFAVIEVDEGAVRMIRSGRTTELVLKTPAPVEVPDGTQRIFGYLGPVQAWQSVNATADFGFSGKAMVAMYEHATGERLDGVIALDVPALASMLRVLGPVNVPGLNEPLTFRNAPSVLLNKLYEDLPVRENQEERREVLSEVLRATVARMTGGGYEPLRLARAMADAAAGLHFRLYSEDAAVEQVLHRSGLGGGPATEDADRTIHFAVQNFTATKLDYFVKPRAEVDVEITSAGDAEITTRIIIANEAPKGAKPSYQLGPDGINTTVPGQYITQVYFWGPQGAVQSLGVPESGLTVNYDPAEVLAGEEKTLTFRTTVPSAVRDGRLDLRFVPQPRLWPVPLRVSVRAPDWTIFGRSRIDVAGTRTVTVGWRLERQ